MGGKCKIPWLIFEGDIDILEVVLSYEAFCPSVGRLVGLYNFLKGREVIFPWLAYFMNERRCVFPMNPQVCLLVGCSVG